MWAARHDRDRLKEYFAAVYPLFWRKELDIEDVEVVSRCLTSAGIVTEGFNDFCETEGRALHDQLRSQLHPNGIYGVPTYVFENEVLFGREHLPYVEWRLSGRMGAAPDISHAL